MASLSKTYTCCNLSKNLTAFNFKQTKSVIKTILEVKSRKTLLKKEDGWQFEQSKQLKNLHVKKTFRLMEIFDSISDSWKKCNFIRREQTNKVTNIFFAQKFLEFENSYCSFFTPRKMPHTNSSSFFVYHIWCVLKCIFCTQAMYKTHII